MKIGIVFDMKETYDLDDEEVDYCDFCFLSEAESAKRHLELSGFEVDYIGSPNTFAKNIFEIKDKYSLIYNISEGFKSRNREGLVPALCEIYDIPCTGSDSFGNSFSLHKFQTKLFLKNFAISTAKDLYFDPQIHTLDYLYANLENKIGYPALIKPNHEGSSMGVKKIDNRADMERYVSDFLSKYKQDMLIEEYIEGSELSVCILGSCEDAEVFSVVQYIDSQGADIRLLTSELKQIEKYNMQQPQLPKAAIEKLMTDSLLIHKILKLRDISRVDWRYCKTSSTSYFLEITPLPVLCEGTEFEWACKQKGLPYSYVFKSIVKSAASRK